MGNRSPRPTHALALALAALAGTAGPAAADEFTPVMAAAFEEMVAPWLADPVLVEAIRAQNRAHEGLSAAEIAAMDEAWRAEVAAGGGPLTERVTTGPAAAFLKEKGEAGGAALTEIFVMDARGLNVAANALTSDYMQGDEAKFTETFGVGAGAVHAGEVEFDSSTEAFQAQYSATLTDPDTGEPIGAITVGIRLEELL